MIGLNCSILPRMIRISTFKDVGSYTIDEEPHTNAVETAITINTSSTSSELRNLTASPIGKRRSVDVVHEGRSRRAKPRLDYHAIENPHKNQPQINKPFKAVKPKENKK